MLKIIVVRLGLGLRLGVAGFGLGLGLGSPLLLELSEVQIFALRRSTLDFCLGGQRFWG